MRVEHSALSFAAARFGGAFAGRARNVVTVIGTVLGRMLSAHERWRQRQALLALDDHMLKDIGVTRADVEREVGKRPWEE